MTVLETALALAADGLAVFPCLAEKKQPACKHGFKAAVRGERAVADLFRRYPGELIGVPTGPVNGFDALDIDPRHGGTAWQDEFAGYLPRTRIHTTRSGGTHYLFAHHPGIRNSEAKIAPGVDTRGDGGYIIWWPVSGCAVPCTGPLAPWPQWLLDLLLPPPAPSTPPAAKAAKKAANDDDEDQTQTRRIVQRCLDRVARASPGDRHKQLRRASYAIGGLIGEGVGETEAKRALLDAVIDAGGGDVDRINAAATIASGLKAGAGKPIKVDS